MFNTIKAKLESMFACKIYRNSIPQGTDLFTDLQRSFGLDRFKVVFDIGANVGQSAIEYSNAFSNADVYSFEPVASTYSHLRTNIQKHPRIQAFQCAMGAQKATGTINVNAVSTTSSLLHAGAEVGFSSTSTAEQIAIDTVSDFCTLNGLQTIDFLKTDTEGYELEVLQGCALMLAKQQIKIVMAECSPQVNDNYFVSFSALSEFLGTFQYVLFGIYGQQLSWNGQKKILFFNPVFVCPDMVNVNT